MRVWVAAAVLFAAARAATAQTTLGNIVLSAQFDDRGLAAIVDADTGTYRFVHDDFALVIDGKSHDSRSLQAPAHTASRDRATYTWAAGAFSIDVIYEVRPDWRFVSNQLAIRSPGAANHRVDEVIVFRAEVVPRIEDVFVPKSARPSLGTGDYGGFVRFDGRGLLAAVQNPFLEFSRDGQAFSIRYRPRVEWRSADRSFLSDRGLLAPYRSSGRRIGAAMLPEWKIASVDSADGADQAEIDAFTHAVRAFLLHPPTRPLNLFVGWCANDYQIDVGTADGRVEYKRLIDRAAELGAEYVLYAPSNSDVSRREASVDDWRWEHVLWLGLGQRMRTGQWDPVRDPIPASIREMLDYAAVKHVKLLAYVYPVLPFAGDPSWLVTDRGRPYASLGNRSWQDRLINLLVAFRDRTGIGGYSFDHTFLTYPGTSSYAQWSGWRRIVEELRRRVPDIVVDGRQAFHLYGPWSWLAGSYPHPTFNDEQPESFVPFPDLHFDRVSADRERYTAYRYRNYEFAPSEIVPGFITHQTPRLDASGAMPSVRTTDRGVVLTPFRVRDWDALGWRYSLLSSIAVGGWNNVINMIPARDVEEYRAFSDDDQRWFRRWIEWADRNKQYLRETRTILGPPRIGKVDGTSAIVGERGYLFLFNPNARGLTAEFSLDPSIGLRDHFAPVLIRELYPLDGRLIGKPGSGVWTAGDRVSIPMDGQSAVVLELAPADSLTRPLLFGVPGTATADDDGMVRVTGVRGEVGTSADIFVMFPDGRSATTLHVNGQSASFSQTPAGLLATVRFAGTDFRHAQQIGGVDASFNGGIFSAAIAIPAWVFDQLRTRSRSAGIHWTAEDRQTTWLAPERLLLYVPIAEADDDRLDARLTIDGRLVPLQRAYTAVRPAKSTFTGFYADVSNLSADIPHQIEVRLPALRPGQFQGVFLDNIEPLYTDQLRR
jgi:hypothetical protein